MKKYIIGIDEVGRGPLAGPVTVAGVLIPPKQNLRQIAKKIKTPLKDSKKLSTIKRTMWVNRAKENKISYVVTSISPAQIDKLNISKAVNIASGRVISRLIAKTKIKTSRLLILTDAGIRPACPKNLKLKCLSFVKGDEKIPAISLASIIAKSHRDAYMTKIDKKFPAYHFKENKGYGTKTHFSALKTHGLSPIHRLTFIKKYTNVKSV